MIDSHPRRVNIASMLRGRKQGDGASQLSTARVNLASTQGDAAVLLPRIGISDSQVRAYRTRLALGPMYGPVALAILAAATLTVALLASGAPSVLVVGSERTFPGWMSGPLHALLSPVLQSSSGKGVLPWQTTAYIFSGAIVVMMVAYGVALAAARALSPRAIAITIAVVYALMLMSPPLGLSDIFNYLGYARLEGLHGLNPYTHFIADEHYDPAFLLATWRHYHSPYGQVFSLLSYPLGGMSLAAAYWVLKVGMVLLMGAFAALVWKCARQLGHDPRFPVLLVALNPLVVIFGVGGFHNDPVMLVPMMAAVSLLLARRYRWAGVALAVAIGAKTTIVLLLPFLMLAARPARRSLQVLAGAVLGGIPIAALSFVAFGTSMPNVADQSIIVTPYSVVNLVGVLFGLGGASPGVEEASKIVLVAFVVVLLVMALWRGRPDWLSGAGWATLGLLVCTAWLMPWYIVWALPLVALSSSRPLRRAMAAFIVFATLSFLPVTAMGLGALHVNMMKSPADQAAVWRLYYFQH